MFGLSVTNMSPRFASSIHWCINTPSADSNVCSICLPLSGAICFDQPIRYGMSTSLVAIYTDKSICHRSRVEICIGRLIGHGRSVTIILANRIFLQYILKIISYCRRCEISSFLHTQYCRMAESWPPQKLVHKPFKPMNVVVPKTDEKYAYEFSHSYHYCWTRMRHWIL